MIPPTGTTISSSTKSSRQVRTGPRPLETMVVGFLGLAAMSESNGTP
jgi:hypothetical protein